MKSFSQFWPFYLGEHREARTHGFHASGTLIGLVCLFVVVPWTRNWFWALLGFGLGYGLAWISHFTIERNRPATFRYPLWSFFADVEMLGLWLTGKLEVERHRQADREVPVVSHGRRMARRAIRGVFWAWLAVLVLLDVQGFIGLRWPWT